MTQVVDMRDLRFMAAVYCRQHRVKELIELWKQPPPNLEKVMREREYDFTILRVETARESNDWELLFNVCAEEVDKVMACLDEAVSSIDDESSKKLIDLCVEGLAIWTGLVDSATELVKSKSPAAPE